MPDISERPFDHVRRMQDARFPHEIAAIMPGEYFVSGDPMIVYTVLGSCVSTCIRDVALGIGGMNHFMLPLLQDDGRWDSWGESARYGNFAMEILINDILRRGGRKDQLEVKVFGGARMYEGMNDVGANNTAWALEYLKDEGLNPLKVDTGGIYPRKIYYFTATGRVLLKRVARLKNRTVIELEQQYEEILRRRRREGDMTIFEGNK